MASYFGDRLREIRESNKWTLEEMASKLSTTKQALSRYERGERIPKITVAARIADVLGVPLEELVGYEYHAEEPTFEDAARGEDLKKFSAEDYHRLDDLHQNPRLGLLFDHSRKMKQEDVDFMIQMAERILNERDGK